MSRKQIWRGILAIMLLLPFVILQGIPALTPDLLLTPILGVPGTVWLITLVGYGGFVALGWTCKHE